MKCCVTLILLVLLFACFARASPQDEWEEISSVLPTQPNTLAPKQSRLPLALSKWMTNNNLSEEQESKLTELLHKVNAGYDKHAAVRDWHLATKSSQQAAEWPWDSPSAAPTAAPANYHGMPDPLNAPIVNPDLPGVVFYTGLTGTSLYASLSKPGGFVGLGCGPQATCACNTEEFLLYASVEQLVLQTKCFFANLELGWDSVKQTIVGIPGVKVYTKNGPSGFDPNGDGYGGPGCLSTEDGHCFAWTGFQDTLIEQYDYSMAQFRTVVWDWRLGPNEWAAAPAPDSLFETGNFEKTKSMYEELYAQTGKASYVVTISEGGTIFKSFLQYVDQDWKDRYIEGWFSYSGVFAGASDMAYSQMSGEAFYPNMIKSMNPLHFSTFTSEQFRKATEAFPGQAVTSPIATGDAAADSLLLFTTPSRNYTYAEYAEALRDNGLETTASVMDSIADTRPNFENPGVRMWCIYGTGVSTPITMQYEQDFNGVHSDTQPTIIHGMGGDGTVHEASLDVCKRWTASAAQQVVGTAYTTVHHYLNQSHTGVLSHLPAVSLFAQEMNRVTGKDFSFGL
jgi:hypothetical protein